jgi:aspartate racemase
MTAHRKPVIGILGGMGPEATVDLMRRVIAATPARDDCDHLHMIVDCNPHVPSRIAALVDGTGASPAPELVRMARRLEAAGAGMLAIACNTAHAYAGDIRAAVPIPLLDMIELTADAVAALTLTRRRIGLLASTAVLRIGLYARALERRGIAVAAPARQEQLMEVIRAVKRGDTGQRNRESFARIASELMEDRVDLLLVACTELSVLSDSLGAGMPSVDALDVLAREIVHRARGVRPAEMAEVRGGA